MMARWPTGETYVIWSHEHGKWWAPNAHGYVSRLDEAGRYTQKIALEICGRSLAGTYDAPNDLPVRVLDLYAMAAFCPGPSAIDPEDTGAT